jgi:cysteine desulfurase
MSGRIYLDYNATAPLHPAARSALVAGLSVDGNPSSVHSEGRAARALLERARAQVAAFVGAQAGDVVFTSGGTEAANLALTPTMENGAGQPVDVLFVSATEHSCVLSGHRFAPDQVSILPVLPDGTLDLARLDEELGRVPGKRVMLALQVANNETGVVQPVAEAAQRVHAHGGLLVCDAVQGAGRLRLDMSELGADALILSAHKIGGPKGAGALVLRTGNARIGRGLIRGGGQERGARAGTENVAAMAGFGAACESVDGLSLPGLLKLRGALEETIRSISADATFFGAHGPRLPNTVCFAVPGCRSEMLLMALDLDGIAVSSGAACSSGKVGRSHVLDAMGISGELAAGAIRLSLGWNSSSQDVADFGRAFAGIVARLRRVRSRAA